MPMTPEQKAKQKARMDAHFGVTPSTKNIAEMMTEAVTEERMIEKPKDPAVEVPAPDAPAKPKPVRVRAKKKA